MSNDVTGDLSGLWLFSGPREFPRFPSGVFRCLSDAEAWIGTGSLSGTLTWYPVGIGAYDWAVQRKLFVPRKREQSEAAFIEQFSDASQPHHHYESGINLSRSGPGTGPEPNDEERPSPVAGRQGDRTTATVWVFSGPRRSVGFPSGVFDSPTAAETWIARHGLSGTLRLYPLDVGVFDWALGAGLFQPSEPSHTTPRFVESFSSPRQEHRYYCRGELVGA